MMVPARRRGRKPLPPADRRERVPWSMPRRLIDRVAEIAEARDVPFSTVAEEFIQRGLVEHEIRERMNGRAA